MKQQVIVEFGNNVRQFRKKRKFSQEKLAHKAEIKKQRDDYESLIKANYNRFQKIRYRQMHFNGMSFDYTAFNQLFTPIKKRK
mgnify:CR=1 FL=1